MKDPAFLFYSSDFLSGTMLMSDEQVGKYIKLLCLQHQKGHLKEKDMLNICGTYDEDIFSKFQQDEEDNYYNERLEYEANKRSKFVESRRQARKKCDEDSVRIYMILDKDTGFIKIGSSVNPQRRFAEMCNQKNPAITVGNRNYELIFVSKIVERKIEKQLHEEYKSKNITGEWFSLTEEDIKNIQKTYEDTYEQLTGNENENINTNNNIINNNISDENIAKIDKLMVECLNTTNTNSIMECVSYLDKLPIEIIEYTLKKTSRLSNPNWGYAMTVLDDYVRKKFTTVEQAKADDLKRKSNTQKNKNATAEEEFLSEFR